MYIVQLNIISSEFQVLLFLSEKFARLLLQWKGQAESNL